jgi:hypothetical protein
MCIIVSHYRLAGKILDCLEEAKGAELNSAGPG